MQAWREMRHGLIGAEREKAQDEDRLSTDTEGERTSLERARERRVERERTRGERRGRRPKMGINHVRLLLPGHFFLLLLPPDNDFLSQRSTSELNLREPEQDA